MKELLLGVLAVAVLSAPAAARRPPTCVAEPCSITAFVGAGVKAKWGSAQRFAHGTSLRVQVFMDGVRVRLGHRGDWCSMAGRSRGVALAVSACRGGARTFRLMLHVRSAAPVDRRVRVEFHVMGGVL